MSSMQGTVKKITEKSVSGRNYFGVVLENSDELYRCGENRPTCRVGDWITFDVNNTKWGPFVKDNTLIVGSNTPPSTPTNINTYVDKEAYWANKEIRDVETQKKISYNAAYNSALKFVELALNNGAITLGAGKASAKFTVLAEVVDKVTSENYKKFQNAYRDIDREMFTEKELREDPVSKEPDWPNQESN